MPKLLSAKSYPALVDVYYQIRVQNPESGAITTQWVYTDPNTFRCTYMSLRGHEEEFGKLYEESDTVKLEVSPYDAQFINLSMRFGNIRMRHDETEEYYRFVGNRFASLPVKYFFNIDSMNPQVDNNGRVVCVEVYGKLAQTA